MMELSQKRVMGSRAPIVSTNQQSRLVIALVLLLTALAAVLIKDRQFWFGSESTIIDANDYQEPVASQTANPVPSVAETATKPASPAIHAPAITAKKQVPVANPGSQPKPAEAPVVITNRAVVPPLDVEVVAGNTHRDLRQGNRVQKVEILKPATPVARQSAPVAAPATNAAQRERLAEAIPPSYPALAQHMNVQGSVVLQALISSDGTVQNLRVMSGPSILASAAQQAVREWRFKPVYQNGQAVETRATITVNFTIRVADSMANTTLADSRDNDVTITQQ